MKKTSLKIVSWTLVSAVALNSISVNAVNVTAKTKIQSVKKTDAQLFKKKLVSKKNGKVVSGYALYEEKLYKNGGIFTGKVNSILYKDGKKAKGVIQGILYINGKKFSGLKNGLMYEKGKKATGVIKGSYYKNGKKSSATIKGLVYVKGQLATGVIQNIYYKKGKKATGTVKNIYYYKGKMAVGVVNGMFYVKGEKATGIANDGRLFIKGVENKGPYYYKEQWYSDTAIDEEKNKAIADYLAILEKQLVENEYTASSWAKYRTIVHANQFKITDANRTTAQWIESTKAIQLAIEQLAKPSTNYTPSAATVLSWINNEKAMPGNISTLLKNYAQVLNLPVGFASMNPAVIQFAEKAIIDNMIATPAELTTIVREVVQLETVSFSPVLVWSPTNERVASEAAIRAVKNALNDTTNKYSYQANKVPTRIAVTSVPWYVTVQLNNYNLQKKFTLTVEKDPNLTVTDIEKERVLEYINTINVKEYKDEQAAVALVNEAKADLANPTNTETVILEIEKKLTEGLQELIEKEALAAYEERFHLIFSEQGLLLSKPGQLAIDTQKNTLYLDALKDYRVDIQISLANSLENTDLVNISTSLGDKGTMQKLAATSEKTGLLSALINSQPTNLVGQIPSGTNFIVNFEAERLTNKAILQFQAVAVKGSKEIKLRTPMQGIIDSPIGQDKANEVNELIKNLPGIISIGQAEQNAYLAAKTAYEKLTEEEKKLVGEETKLKELIAEQEALKHILLTSEQITTDSYKVSYVYDPAYKKLLDDYMFEEEIIFSRELTEDDGQYISYPENDDISIYKKVARPAIKLGEMNKQFLKVGFKALTEETTLSLNYLIKKNGVIVKRASITEQLFLSQAELLNIKKSVDELTVVENGETVLANSTNQTKLNELSQRINKIGEVNLKTTLLEKIKSAQELLDKKIALATYNGIVLVNETTKITSELPDLNGLTNSQLTYLNTFYTDIVVKLNKAVSINNKWYTANEAIYLSTIQNISVDNLKRPTYQNALNFDLAEFRKLLNDGVYEVTFQPVLVKKVAIGIVSTEGEYGDKLTLSNFNVQNKTTFVSKLNFKIDNQLGMNNFEISYDLAFSNKDGSSKNDWNVMVIAEKKLTFNHLQELVVASLDFSSVVGTGYLVITKNNVAMTEIKNINDVARPFPTIKFTVY